MPVIGCSCEVCRSKDPHDKRFRSAALVESDTTRILLDCGPDIRMQLLPQPFRKIDGLLLTHEHYDHVGGLDDLRPYCMLGDIDIFANRKTVEAVKHNFPYCFTDHLYPGVPRFNMHRISPHQPLRIGDIDIMPISVMHDQLPILGFRFGKLAYITDMKTLPDTERPYLEGVETLIINALRWGKPHHSHLIIPEAIDFARSIGARQTYFTHLTHLIGLHDVVGSRLPQGFHFAYDGEVLTWQ